MNNCAKKSVLIIALLFTLSNCHEKSVDFFSNEYNELIYSRSEVGYGDSYSLKLTQADTVYFQRHKYNPAKEIKYCLINTKDKEHIMNELRKVKWAALDSVYIQQGIEDGTNRIFYMKKGKVRKAIFMYGEEGPTAVLAVANWLDNFRAKQEFKAINKKIGFGDLHHIVRVWPAMPKIAK